MASHNLEIDRLIQALARLPGFGPRSARRAVLHLIKKRQRMLGPLAEALKEVGEKIRDCEICGNLDTLSPCSICSDGRRDRSLVCVVEQVADLWALDRAEGYKGLYHVLGGTLSALDGVMPEDLNLSALVERARSDEVKEVILATNATVDGQTTGHYIADRLKDTGVLVTGIAHGVPVGGELDYLDEGTLQAALKARKPV
jgi:recombination protein RecR